MKCCRSMMLPAFPPATWVLRALQAYSMLLTRHQETDNWFMKVFVALACSASNGQLRKRNLGLGCPIWTQGLVWREPCWRLQGPSWLRSVTFACCKCDKPQFLLDAKSKPLRFLIHQWGYTQTDSNGLPPRVIQTLPAVSLKG